MRTVLYECEYILNAHLKTNESLLQVFPDQRPHKSELESWLTSSCHLQSLRPPPPQSDFLFISSSCFPIQLLTCVSMYSTKVLEREKEKGWNKWAKVPLLECEEVKEEGAGRIQISAWSLVENQNKITCCRNISRLTQHPLAPLLSPYLSQSPPFSSSCTCTASEFSFPPSLVFSPRVLGGVDGPQQSHQFLTQRGWEQSGKTRSHVHILLIPQPEEKYPHGPRCLRQCVWRSKRERAGGGSERRRLT